MNQEEPSFASKIVKIAHQQTLGLLLSNCYCLVFELLFFDLYSKLTISGVIELRFKRDLSRWKAKTWGYKFNASSRTKFSLQDSQNCSSTNTWTVTVQLLLFCFLTHTVWPLLILLTISGGIELRFKRDQSRWKSKTWGYKFNDSRRTQFCL